MVTQAILDPEPRIGVTDESAEIEPEVAGLATINVSDVARGAPIDDSAQLRRFLEHREASAG